MSISARSRMGRTIDRAHLSHPSLSLYAAWGSERPQSVRVPRSHSCFLRLLRSHYKKPSEHPATLPILTSLRKPPRTPHSVITWRAPQRTLMTALGKIAEKLHLKPPAAEQVFAEAEAEAKKGPALDDSKITIIFVLGGPGAGINSQHIRPQACSSWPPCRQGYAVRKARSRVWLLPSVRYANVGGCVPNPAYLPRVLQRVTFSAPNRTVKAPNMVP